MAKTAPAPHKGLDFRTRPETDAGPPPSGNDANMMDRLHKAVNSEMAATAAPAVEKKKSSPAGTTPSAGTDTHDNDSSNRRDGQPSGDGAGSDAGSSSTRDGNRDAAGRYTGRADAGRAAADAPPRHDDGTAPVSPEPHDEQPETGDDRRTTGGDNESDAPETDPLKILAAAQAPAAETATTTAPTAPAAAKPVTPGSALRTKLEQTLSENRDLQRRLKEGDTATASKLKDITTAFEAEQRRAAELEAKLAQLDFSQSPEFRSRYVEPYENGYKDAIRRLNQFPKEDGTALAKPELDAIMTGTEEQSFEAIEKFYGNGPRAEVVKSLIRDVHALGRTQERELMRAQSTALETRRQRESAERAQRETLWQHYEEERDKRFGSMPELAQPKEGDKAHQRLLAEGLALADAAVTPPEQATPQQRMALMAEVRNRAATQPVAVALWKREQARVAELEAELAKYRQHAPGRGEVEDAPGTAHNDEETGTMEFAEAALRAHLTGANP